MSKEVPGNSKFHTAQSFSNEPAGVKCKKMRKFGARKCDWLKSASATAAGQAMKKGRATTKRISTAMNPRRSI